MTTAAIRSRPRLPGSLLAHPFQLLREVVNAVYIFSVANDVYLIETVHPLILKAILVIFAVANLSRFRTFNPRLCPYFIPLILVAFGATLLNLHSYEAPLEPIAMIVAMTVIVVVCSQGNLDRYAKYFWFSMLFSIAVCIFINTTESERYLRQAGGVGDPNEFAANVFSFLFVGFFLGRRTGNRLYAIASLALCFVGILYAASKTALVALIILGVVTMAMRLFHRGDKAAGARSLRGWTYSAIGLVAAFIVLLFILSRGDYRDRMSYYADRFESSQSFDNRMLFWQAGLEMGLSRPWGVGIRNFAHIAPEYFKGYYPEDIFAAHNVFIAVFGEMGIVGLVLFLLILYDTLQRLIRFGIPETSALAMQFIAYLVMGLTLTMINDKFFWFSLALCLNGIAAYGGAATRVARRPAGNRVLRGTGPGGMPARLGPVRRSLTEPRGGSEGTIRARS